MENYEALKVIGSGSFGVIRKVRRKSDGKILARKEIDYNKMSEREKKQLVTEVNILRELRHPNIVRYFERFVDREKSLIYIIMEYCEGGDLAAIIKRCQVENKRLPESIIWSFLTQLIRALHECHFSSRGTTILHRDIKPGNCPMDDRSFILNKIENVFLDANQNIKLGDFGLSKVMSHPEREFTKTFVGTPYYMSPELVGEKCYNTKSDIWALGCLIYELCSLEPPFKAKTQEALSARIQSGNPPIIPSIYSNDLGKVLRLMLQTDQNKRPNTIELLQHERISLYAKEQELNHFHSELKRREEILKEKEQELITREKNLQIKEQEQLEERENNYSMRSPFKVQSTHSSPISFTFKRHISPLRSKAYKSNSIK